MRALLLATLVLASCDYVAEVRAANQAINARQTFKVSGKNCWYAEVDGMPCLFCERTSASGHSGYGGHSCDWSKWQPPAFTRETYRGSTRP